MMTDTPPMASTVWSPVDDAFYIHSYFSKTYEPLSNLPTPPLPTSKTGQVQPPIDVNDGLDPTLLGAAIHLKNLIPSSVSLLDPSVHVVHAVLVRAKLPLSTIALAVCILDSLNSKFARAWRQTCPLTVPVGPSPQEPHIDSIRPEVIVLAALIISVKFLDDQETSTKSYAENWGSRQWSCTQINASLQCVMENLRFRILPLWTEELIAGALEDMETAQRYASGLLRPKSLRTKDLNLDLDLRAVITHQAVWSDHELITPVETPKSDNVLVALDVFKTRQPFGLTHDLSGQSPKLPTVTVTDFFPA